MSSKSTRGSFTNGLFRRSLPVFIATCAFFLQGCDQLEAKTGVTLGPEKLFDQQVVPVIKETYSEFRQQIEGDIPELVKAQLQYALKFKIQLQVIKFKHRINADISAGAIVGKFAKMAKGAISGKQSEFDTIKGMIMRLDQKVEVGQTKLSQQMEDGFEKQRRALLAQTRLQTEQILKDKIIERRTAWRYWVFGLFYQPWTTLFLFVLETTVGGFIDRFFGLMGSTLWAVLMFPLGFCFRWLTITIYSLLGAILLSIDFARIFGGSFWTIRGMFGNTGFTKTLKNASRVAGNSAKSFLVQVQIIQRFLLKYSIDMDAKIDSRVSSHNWWIPFSEETYNAEKKRVRQQRVIDANDSRAELKTLVVLDPYIFDGALISYTIWQAFACWFLLASLPHKIWYGDWLVASNAQVIKDEVARQMLKFEEIEAIEDLKTAVQNQKLSEPALRPEAAPLASQVQ